MGRKKLEKRDSDELLSMLIGMFVPKNILNDFEVWDGFKQKENWVLELREKEDRIPIELKNIEQEIVLDGFCNPIEMLSFGFSLGPVYLRIYRRRWKISADKEHFSNEYDLHLKGYKLVPELGFFFKRRRSKIRQLIFLR